MSGLKRGVVLLIALLTMVPWAAAQSDPTDGAHKAMQKAFEGIVTFSQSLSGWSLLIAGGSIVVLVGTGYYRPRTRWTRLIYLAFLPGWFFLGHSMFYGVQVQRANLGYLFAAEGSPLGQYKSAVNDDALGQILAFQHAVYCFGVWLVLYFLWWLWNQEAEITTGSKP